MDLKKTVHGWRLFSRPLSAGAWLLIFFTLNIVAPQLHGFQSESMVTAPSQHDGSLFQDPKPWQRFSFKRGKTGLSTTGNVSSWRAGPLIKRSDKNLPRTRIPLPAAHRPSIDKMIAQMLMIGFSGTRMDQKGPQQVRSLLEQQKIGGLIFMGHNMRSKAQINKLVRAMYPPNMHPANKYPAKLRNASNVQPIAYSQSPSHKQSIAKSFPLPFLAIDQEGGKVQRLTNRHGFRAIPSAKYMSTRASPVTAYKTYKILADELAHAGFNMNFGPVVDLNRVPKNPIIGGKERSYGQSAPKVITYAKSFILAHKTAGLITTLKHFPGHGSSWTDSHKQFVNITNDWHPSELAPYRRLSKDGLADSVMVGHLYHPRFADKPGIPASLSHKAIIGVLRGQLGFKGLVVTDDLDMAAITKHFSFEDRIIRAVKAGNDILLFSGQKYARPDQIERITGIIKTAILKGKIRKSRIQAAYKRIMSQKQMLAHKQRQNFQK